MKAFIGLIVSLGFFASLIMIPASVLLGIWVDVRWWPMIFFFVLTTIVSGVFVSILG